MQGSLCGFIIDSGSQENIISKDVVKRLQLETRTSPLAHMRVHECFKVSF